jgi:hypothetical protein
MPMKYLTLMRWIFPLLAIVFVVFSYDRWGWSGVAGSLGLIVMWVLLHFSRMMQVLRRAQGRPIGYVDSAVMLNAKLKSGVPLLHVLALTRALGLLLTEKDAQPEIFRWKDGGGSYVDATFQNGRLRSWALTRPTVTAHE